MTESNDSIFQVAVPEIQSSLVKIHQLIDGHGVERKLSHLMMLRASQINQCGYCVEMHTREAREEGETNERIDQVVVFKQSQCFSEQESVALEWTETLTELDATTDYRALRVRLLQYYSSEQIAAMTALVGMINIWNRIRISGH